MNLPPGMLFHGFLKKGIPFRRTTSSGENVKFTVHMVDFI
jgi:hypothetical protein